MLDIPRHSMNRGGTAGRTKGDETCVHATIETRNAVWSRGGRGNPITSRSSFPFFLTSLFEELIAASIRLCRRYHSVLWFSRTKIIGHTVRVAIVCVQSVFLLAQSVELASKETIRALIRKLVPKERNEFPLGWREHYFPCICGCIECDTRMCFAH